eukprot:scaffold30112_cov112-Isochrysis_galbana.AAC.3
MSGRRACSPGQSRAAAEAGMAETSSSKLATPSPKLETPSSKFGTAGEGSSQSIFAIRSTGATGT